MRTVAFVPIKFESERLKHKNFLPLGNKPLCWYIFHTLLQVPEIDEVFVFCSNPEVQTYLPKGVTFLERPTSLDTNLTLGLDIYKAFTQKVEADVYVLAHATSPFIRPSSVSEGLQKIKAEGYDSAFSAEKQQTFAWYKNQPLNYALTHIPRTQDLEPVFLETSAFFMFRKEVLFALNRRIGEAAYMVVTDKYESVDIDTEEDFKLAEALLTVLMEKFPAVYQPSK